MNFRYKLMRFMQGRYGLDTMFYVLFAVSAVLAVVNTVIRFPLLQIAVYVIVIYAFWRVLSRNVSARAKENRIVTGLFYGIRKKYYTYKQHKADTTHIYKKCPKCSAVLRLPKRKGKHRTCCPKCGNEFNVRVG